MPIASDKLNKLGRLASKKAPVSATIPQKKEAVPDTFIGKTVQATTKGLGESLGNYWKETQQLSQLPMNEQFKVQAHRTGSVLKGLGSMVAGIVQYPLRALAKAELSLVEKITGKRFEPEFKGGLSKFVWGEKLTTLQAERETLEETIEEVGGKEWEKKYLPTTLVLGSLGLDLWVGFPKGKVLLRQLKKEASEEATQAILKEAVKKEKLILTDDIISRISKDIASYQDEKQIAKTLLSAQKLAVEQGATIPKSLRKKAELLDIRSRLKTTEKKTKVTTSSYHKTARELNKILNKSETSLRTLEMKRFKENILYRHKKTALVTAFKAKKKSLETMQKEVFQFAKDWLPKEQFERVARDITKTKSRATQIRATRNIILQRKNNLRKEAVDTLDKVLKDLADLPVTSQDKITKLTENLRFFKTTEKAEEKLQKLRDFLETNPAERFKFESKKTLKQLSKVYELDKAPLSEIPLDELIALADKVSFISKEGKLINRVLHGKMVDGQRIQGLLKLEEENMIDALVKETVNLDEQRIVKNLSKEERQTSRLYQTSQQLRKGELNYHNSDVVFEMMDGHKVGVNTQMIKHPVDDALNLADDAITTGTKNLEAFEDALLKKYKLKEFTEAMDERVYIYSQKNQVGGIKTLKNSGVPEKKINAVTSLTAPEKAMYEFLKTEYARFHPRVATTMKNVHGKKLGWIENYAPVQTTFEDVDKVADRMWNTYDRKNITTGLVMERKLIGGEKLNLSARQAYLKYVNDANYFIEVEGVLKKVTGVTGNQKYRDAVGTNASKWLDGYVDLVARKGVPAGYRFNWQDVLRRNIGRAILGYNPSPIIKQPLAKFTALGFLGRHTVLHDKEFMFGKLSQPNLSVLKAIKNASVQQKMRSLDDAAYTEAVRGKRLNKWQIHAYTGIKAVDDYTANNIWYGAYRKYFADEKLAYSLDDFLNGKINKKGVRYADRIARITQGSGKFQDLPQMLTGKNKKALSAIFQFQSFVLNQSQILTYHAVRKAGFAEKNLPKALGLAAPLVGVAYAEDLINVLKAEIYGSETYKERLDERTKKDIALDLAGNVLPPLGILHRFVTDTNTGVPMIDVPTRVAKSGTAIFTAKEEETKIKNGLRALEAALSVKGIAGTGFAGTLTRRGTEIAMMTPVDNLVTAIKAGDRQEAEDILRRAVQNGLNPVAIQASAVTRLKRERTGGITETAEKINKELKKLHPSKRKSYLEELSSEGVLTQEVMKTIMRLRESETLKKSRGE